MTNLKLTYFDVNGGRGEPIRLILHWGDIAFDDHRFPLSDFAEVRKNTPLGQVPTMQIGDRQVTQTNALCRYFGKQTGLYPEEAYQALRCDEVTSVIEDAIDKLVATFSLRGDDLKTARENLVLGPYTTYLRWLEASLQNQGGDYFSGNQISIADIRVFVWVQSLCAGHLEHISTSLAEEVAPLVFMHRNKMLQHEKIKAYYAER